ncbi:hypothetical protein ColKHC_12006 [Colletotrichum higginsianum]|nr:hypothetical protein ColKHC_12006 [Colletotrichum higginsianum]
MWGQAARNASEEDSKKETKKWLQRSKGWAAGDDAKGTGQNRRGSNHVGRLLLSALMVVERWRNGGGIVASARAGRRTQDLLTCQRVGWEMARLVAGWEL